MDQLALAQMLGNYGEFVGASARATSVACRGDQYKGG